MPAKKKAKKGKAKKPEKKKKAAKEKPKKKPKEVKNEKGKRIKGVIFDFWGTLVENGVFPSPIRRVRYILRLEIPFSDYVVAFGEAFMLQKFNDLYEAFTKVCKIFGVEPNQKILDILVGMWNKNKMFAKPYSETASVLEELKKDYKVALISNTDCFSLKEVMEKYDLGKYFDAVVLSYEVSMLKSNKKMFKQILEKLGLKEDEVVMVGDSIESDVKGAENAGVRPILVDRRGRREFKDKVNNLNELKALLEKVESEK